MEFFTKILIKTFTLIFVITVCTVQIFATTKTEYYAKILKTIGMSVVGADPTKEPSVATYNLYMSSQIASVPASSFSDKKIIIVCDVPYLENSQVSCDYSKVSAPKQYLQSFNVADKQFPSLDVYSFKDNSSTKIVLPEIYFVSPVYSDALKKYFVGLSNAEKLVIQEINPVNVVDSVKITIDQYADILNVMRYLVVIILLTTVLALAFKYFVSMRSLLTKKTFYISKLEKFNEFLSKFRNPLWIAIILGLILIAPILLFISERDKGTLDFNYIFGYAQNILNPFNIATAFREGRYFRLLFTYTIYAYFILIAFSAIPIFIESLIKLLNSKEIFNNVNPYTRAKSLPIFILVLYALSFFIHNEVVILIFILMSLFYIYLLFCNSKNRELLIYSNRSKIMYLAIFFTIFGALQIAPKFIKIPTMFIYRQLFSESKNVPMLPYKKTGAPNTRYLDYTINIKTPLFLNNYMVYTPSASQIQNMPLKKFDPSTNFIILNAPIDRLTRYIFDNSSLRTLLKTNKESNIFYLNAHREGYPYYLGFTYKCTKTLTPEVTNVTVWTSQDASLTSDNTPVAKIPGCLSSESKTKTFKVPFDLTGNEDKKIIVYVYPKINSNFKDMTLLSANPKIETTRFMYSPTNKILARSPEDSVTDTVKVYSVDTENEFSVLNDPKADFNLASHINNMLDTKLIMDDFEIWADSNTEIILDTN